MIRAIAAIDDKRGLAADDNFPWHIATDVRYFRDRTMGNTIIMGYGTYENLAWPLPGRDNLVASRHHSSLRPGFQLVKDARRYLEQAGASDVWVIGGAALFEATWPLIEELYITEVQGDFQCSKFLPSYEDFTARSVGPWRQEDGFTFRFCVFSRTKKPAGA